MWIGLLYVVAVVNAKNLGGKALGHWTSGMSADTASCEFTFQVQGSATCQQVADSQAMPLSSFRKLNAWIDCSQHLGDETIVCVPSNSSQDTEPTKNGSTVSVTQTQTVDFLLASPSPIAKITTTSTSPSTSTLTSTTTTTTILPSPSPSLTPSPLPLPEPSPEPAPISIPIEVPQPPPELEQEFQQIDPVQPVPPQPSPPPPPAPSQHPQPQPPSQPPATSSNSIDVNECLNLFNSARAQYNPSVGALTWSQRLADLAQQSVNYNAASGCCDASCHILSGGMTGIAQNLFCGVLTCGTAFDGWVTLEAGFQGGHWSNIVGYPTNYAFMGCASSGAGGGGVVCNFSWLA
ncbi:UNVERIFIED_CONTAM: hypothetical protein HDU68_011783 [Siphonaria sp. JEL0065]|nr:hypothetical protein HDU68_011783 [Siphonaria sp. JEL0065]